MSIPITNDKLNEDDEKFKVVLSVVNAPAVKGIIPGIAVVTIIDDDGKFVLFDMCSKCKTTCFLSRTTHNKATSANASTEASYHH